MTGLGIRNGSRRIGYCGQKPIELTSSRSRTVNSRKTVCTGLARAEGI